ncbi:FAD-dependent oxidoreductase [Micromonospora sp. CPCC 206060]|uniref:FAD-dependent oxidoreductase n=1 Tax=Micromonospora sp. CPCC 206060 TaxID=3122406 RepID=UPI002FF0C5B1
MVSAAEFDVLVIGAGVAGLTTAIRFAEAKFSVCVLADRPPLATTSASAGASWGPYLVRDDRVPHWSEQTRLTLEKIAEDPLSGVHLARGLEAARDPVEPPLWVRGVGDFELCRPEELPDGYVCGWRYTVPLVDMPRYLDYLTRRLDAAGGRMADGRINSFVEVAGAARVLVNCTGLGSRTLVPDGQMYPTRGQLVIVDNPGIDTFFQDNGERGELTYFLPHGDRVVLGGCALPGAESLEPDAGSTTAILARCAAVEPRLHGAAVREVRVGLRPSRPRVRVEWAPCAGIPVLHNYGHGGAGITLSWGCADEVFSLSGLQ